MYCKYLYDSSGKTNSGRAPAGGVLAPRRESVDVVEQLRLGHAGVTHQADVDVASDLHAVWTPEEFNNYHATLRTCREAFVVQLQNGFTRNIVPTARPDPSLRDTILI